MGDSMKNHEAEKPDSDADRIRLLLQAGKPVNLKTEVGNRALCEAAQHGNLELMTLLLDNGADPNGYFDPELARKRHIELFSDEAWYMTADYDGDEKELEEIKELEEMLKEDSEGLQGIEAEQWQKYTAAPWSHEIPLFMAAQSGLTNCVSLLINRGADIHKRDNGNQTALWYASNEDVIKLLTNHGLDLKDHDSLGFTSLSDAIYDGPDAIPQIKALIASGADVNATHNRGFTVFMSAVGSLERDVRVLEVLIKAGADPHAVSELGWNAFHAAVDADGEAGEEESVRSILNYLHELGVNINHKNNGGVSPLGIAIEMGRPIEAQVLCELGADVNSIEPRVICSGGKCEKIHDPLIFMTIANFFYPVEKLQILLDHGVHLNVVDEQGRSPIESARADLANLNPDSNDNYTQKNIHQLKQCIQILQNAT